MSYNYEKNWFEYKGKYYGYGTIVKLKPEVYEGANGATKLGGVFEFCKGWTSGWIHFKSTNTSVSKAGIGDIWNPNDIIEYIIEPVYVELKPVWKKSVENYSNAKPEYKHLAFTGTVWYVIIMIFGTLFYDRILIWIMATIIYGIYWVNKYRD